MAIKKNEILPFVTTWIMDGPGGYYACEISQIGKDKHYMSSLTCGIYKKKRKRMHITKQKQIHRTN